MSVEDLCTATLNEMREVRSTMATREQLQGVREDVASVKGAVLSLRKQVGGDDGDGGLRGRIRTLEEQRRIDAAAANGMSRGRTWGIRIGLAVGFMLAGAGTIDIVRSFL